jgi:inner membrane transporter RhtA
MSVNPAFAALTGLVILGQSLAAADWLAIAAIVAANVIAVSQGAARRGPDAGKLEAPGQLTGRGR